jgi:hypothetical protein
MAEKIYCKFLKKEASMNRGVALAIVGLLLVVIVSIIEFQEKNQEPIQETKALFEGLDSQVKEIDGIEISEYNRSIKIEKRDEFWTIGDDTIVEESSVSQLLLTLIEAQKLQKKTSNPKKYHFLEVDEITNPKSKSKKITLYIDNKPIHTIIVGKDATIKWDKKQAYIRENKTSWLVSKIDTSKFKTNKESWNINYLKIPKEITSIKYGNRGFENNQTAWLDENKKALDSNSTKKIKEFINSISTLEIKHYLKLPKSQKEIFSIKNSDQIEYKFYKTDSNNTIVIKTDDRDSLVGKISKKWGFVVENLEKLEIK